MQAGPGQLRRARGLAVAATLAAAIWAAPTRAAPEAPTPPSDPSPPILSPEASPGPARDPAWARPGPGETAFDAQSWQAWAGGRTVVYFDMRGRLDGYERFSASGRRADWRFVDQPCERGSWRESDGVFCFDYPSGTFCYLHLRRAGVAYVRSVDTGEEFSVRLSPEPINCGDAPVSQAPGNPDAPAWRLTRLARSAR